MDGAKSIADTALLPKGVRYVGVPVEQKFARKSEWIFW